jgi:hypothetical protein
LRSLTRYVNPKGGRKNNEKITQFYEPHKSTRRKEEGGEKQRKEGTQRQEGQGERKEETNIPIESICLKHDLLFPVTI